ncbi:unnamed protein product [Caenorhabditis bovis]|uniref:SSD domain-containing protein n=1 Tax=Caenorhabditis bovis TaxID=2654633 RepID=A0A8S1F4Y5_9PELO|nr:unnamed protein product [Caenorhabditis bovis]
MQKFLITLPYSAHSTDCDEEKNRSDFVGAQLSARGHFGHQHSDQLVIRFPPNMVKLRAAPLESAWSAIVAKYCVFVAKHPWHFIIAPTILTILLSIGIVANFRIVRGVNYLYAPLNATWKTEEAVFGENWAMDDEHFYPGKDVLRRRGIYLIVTAKDGQSVLRRRHAKEFLEILNWVSAEKFVSRNGSTFTYKHVCLHFQNDCFSNTHAKLLADVYSKNHSDAFNITFPIYRSQYATEPIDISKVLGNVTLDANNRVASASAWMILYQLRQFGDDVARLSNDFEQGLAAKIERGETPTRLLNLYYFHSTTFDEELEKENRRLVPKFSITFTVLIVFAVLTTFTIKFVDIDDRRRPLIDWVLSKPLLGVAGVVCTLCAIVSSTGLLMMFDVTFVDMCTVMPFLSLTIGIDDTFLMLAAWHETDRNDPFEKRIETSMRHAAVSISITSLTDSLAFLIGSIAPLPAVIYFCYYSAAAIAFIFAYCMTMFVAVLSLQGRREQNAQHSVDGSDTLDIDTEYGSASKLDLCFRMGSRARKLNEPNNNESEKAHHDGRMWYQRLFEDNYAPFIARPNIGVLSLLAYAAYLTIAFYGSQKLEIGFDLINIVQERSASRTFLEVRDRLFPDDTKLMDVAIMRCPDLADQHHRRQLLAIIDELETTWCSVGRNSTQFWLFELEKYVRNLGFATNFDDILNDPKKLSKTKKTFLMSNEKFAYDVLDDTKFRLSTRLKNVGSDELISKCAATMRSLCAKHSNFSITTYSPLWNFADEFDIMWPQTMQDVYISIAVMVPVALLFIPQPLCSLIIALNIASIAFGVIGSMWFLGVSLDATSMITVAMSVGFSVDFAAHVSYAYMTENRGDGDDDAVLSRFRRTLGTVGWPVIQASFSVLLGVSSLYFVDSYVVQTCFRTVVLVILFGTTHALLFLPLLLLNSHKLYVHMKGD